MDSQKVDMFVMLNSKFFSTPHLQMIRERLLSMDDSKWMMINTVKLKDPTTLLIISILVGALGIDRFMLGQTGLGIGKLLTAGGLGIWAIIDLFKIQDATRELNFKEIQKYLY